MLLGWLALKWLWTYAPMPHLVGVLIVQQYVPFFAIVIAAYRLRARAGRGWPIGVIVAALVTVAGCDGPGYFLVALISTAAMALVALRGVRPLRWAPLVCLGTISYSLYLLHQNIGYFLLRMLEAAGVAPVLAIGIMIVAALLLATLVTYAVERPALAWLRGAYKQLRTSAQDQKLTRTPAA